MWEPFITGCKIFNIGSSPSGVDSGVDSHRLSWELWIGENNPSWGGSWMADPVLGELVMLSKVHWFVSDKEGSTEGPANGVYGGVEPRFPWSFRSSWSSAFKLAKLKTWRLGTSMSRQSSLDSLRVPWANVFGKSRLVSEPSMAACERTMQPVGVMSRVFANLACDSERHSDLEKKLCTTIPRVPSQLSKFWGGPTCHVTTLQLTPCWQPYYPYNNYARGHFCQWSHVP